MQKIQYFVRKNSRKEPRPDYETSYYVIKYLRRAENFLNCLFYVHFSI